MYPRHHTYLGAIFAVILYFVFPQISLLEALIVFFAAVLIDVDHYIYYVFKTKNFSLPRAYRVAMKLSKEHDKLSVKEKRALPQPTMFLHGIEPLILIFIAGIYFPLLNFVAYGFIFHLILDFIEAKIKGYRFGKVSVVYELIR